MISDSPIFDKLTFVSFMTTYFSFSCQNFQTIQYEDVQLQRQQKDGFNKCIILLQKQYSVWKKLSVEDDDIENFGTRPRINKNISPIFNKIEFPQAGQ